MDRSWSRPWKLFSRTKIEDDCYERPESETGDQLLRVRRKRGRRRTPSWQEVEQWRARWNAATVEKALHLLGLKGTTAYMLGEATGIKPLDEHGRQLADLRGLDVTLLPREKRHLGGSGRLPDHMLDLTYVSFDGARLTDLDLSYANLSRVRLRKATLRRCNLTGSNLTKAHLEDADVRDAIVDEARLAFIRYTEDKWLNRGTILQEVNFGRSLYVDPVMERYARDQYYLYVYRYRGNRMQKMWHTIWWFTSDYGRNPLLWAAWCFILVFIFALAYTPPPSWMGSWWVDVVSRYGPKLKFSTDTPVNLLTCLYFSLTTFVAPGLRSIQPANWQAQVLVISENISSFFMLGILISIFVNKVARRA